LGQQGDILNIALLPIQFELGAWSKLAVELRYQRRMNLSLSIVASHWLFELKAAALMRSLRWSEIFRT
jgi:hypothetical protein